MRRWEAETGELPGSLRASEPAQYQRVAVGMKGSLPEAR